MNNKLNKIKKIISILLFVITIGNLTLAQHYTNDDNYNEYIEICNDREDPYIKK